MSKNNYDKIEPFTNMDEELSEQEEDEEKPSPKHVTPQKTLKRTVRKSDDEADQEEDEEEKPNKKRKREDDEDEDSNSKKKKNHDTSESEEDTQGHIPIFNPINTVAKEENSDLLTIEHLMPHFVMFKNGLEKECSQYVFPITKSVSAIIVFLHKKSKKATINSKTFSKMQLWDHIDYFYNKVKDLKFEHFKIQREENGKNDIFMEPDASCMHKLFSSILKYKLDTEENHTEDEKETTEERLEKRKNDILTLHSKQIRVYAMLTESKNKKKKNISTANYILKTGKSKRSSSNKEKKEIKEDKKENTETKKKEPESKKKEPASFYKSFKELKSKLDKFKLSLIDELEENFKKYKIEDIEKPKYFQIFN